MKKYTITEKKTGNKYNITALNESDARKRLLKHLAEQDEKQKHLEECVKNAVKQALNEAALEEGWWDAVKGFGKGVGQEVKNSAPVQYAKHYSKERDAQKAFDKTGKNINKTNAEIDNIISKTLIPALEKRGVLQMGRYNAEGMKRQLSSFIKQFIQKQDPASRPGTTSYGAFKSQQQNPNNYQNPGDVV